MVEDCIFCKIVEKEINSELVADEENFIVINDANPVAEGHCLVISKKHYETIFDMPASLGSELISITKKQGLRLINEGKADGIKLVNNNYQAAGQLVKHFHLHVIPEKNDVKREKGV